MQEADVLGDRIAIIDHGQLKTIGTPMYLKARYGSGSNLKIVHKKSGSIASIIKQLQDIVPMQVKSQV